MSEPIRVTQEKPDPVTEFVRDTATSGINSALLGLPEGVARGTPIAKMVNSLLLGAPEAMIGAAGGKQALLDRLQKQSAGNVVGNIGGTIAGGFLPGMGALGALAKGKTLLGTLGRTAALSGGMTAGEQMVRTNEVDPAAVGASAVLGPAAYGAGKALGAVTKGIAKPGADVAETVSARQAAMSNVADDAVLANVYGIRNLGMRKYVSGAVKGTMSPEAVARDKKTMADVARRLGVKGPQDLPKVSEAAEQAWAVLDKEWARQGMKNSDFVSVIEKDPDVQAYLARGAKGAPPDVILARGNFPSMKGVDPKEGVKLADVLRLFGFDGSANLKLDDTMKGLLRMSHDVYKQAQSPTGEYIAGNTEALKSLGDALMAVRRNLIDGVAEKSGADVKELRDLWKARVIAEDAMLRAEMNINGASIAPNSSTAWSQFLQSGNPFKAMANAFVGPVVNKVMNATVNRGIGQMAYNAPNVIYSPQVTNALAGAQKVGQALNASGVAPGLATAQARGFGLTGQPTGITEPVAGIASPIADKKQPSSHLYQTGGTTPEGYKSSVFDEQMEKVIDDGFSVAYRDVLAAAGLTKEAEADLRRQWRDGVLKMVHLPDGSINPVEAAKVLFFKQPESQALFTKSLGDVMNFTSVLDKVIAKRGWSRGNIASFLRNVSPGSEQAGDYNALRTAYMNMVGEGSQASAERFDRVMQDIFSDDATLRKRLLSDYVRFNQPAAQLLSSVGVQPWNK